jgi:hypothetical protein
MAKRTVTYHSIRVKDYNHVQEEYTANAAITPGMMIELMSTNKVRKHATASGNALPMFALEDTMQGKGVNDDYAAGDKVQVWIPTRGDQVDALLSDEQSVTIGDLLESDGFGKMQKYVADKGDSGTNIQPSQIIGVALETLDLSTLPEGSESSAGGAYYNPRILMRLM